MVELVRLVTTRSELSTKAHYLIVLSPVSGVTDQKLNMKGIQQYGRKWRDQARRDGWPRKWTSETVKDLKAKMDKVFA